MRIKTEADRLLAMIRDGRTMSAGQKVRLAVMLSVPAVVAQLSSIVMQYIDASMVGSLGAEASAAIGLVSTTTWLFGGLLSAAASGFSVQVAHRIGAGDWEGAQRVLRQSVVAVLAFSLLLASICLHPSVPASAVVCLFGLAAPSRYIAMRRLIS